MTPAGSRRWSAICRRWRLRSSCGRRLVGTQCPWWQNGARPGARWPWSPPARCAPLPKPADVWPRRTGSLLRSWRTSPRRCTRLPARCPLPAAQGQEVAALVERRRQGVALRTAEQHRLGTPRTPAVRAPIHAHLEGLDADRRALDDELPRRVKASPLWQERAAVLRRAPGGGPLVSLTLVADLPERGRRSHAQLAARVGVAPLHRASGIWRGRRRVWGGRAAVRAALSLGTLRATRCHPVIPSSARSTTASWRRAKPSRSRWWRAGTSCSPSSTRWSGTRRPGRLRRPEPAREWARHVTVALLSSWEH
jgi:transposase IS116/IS110/IS902 family protein